MRTALSAAALVCGITGLGVEARQPGAFDIGSLEWMAGAQVRVSVRDYLGADPWQEEDLVSCPGQEPRRFAEATPEEQAQATSGAGPCRFVSGGPPGYGYRATADGHTHADFNKAYGQAPDGTLDVLVREPTRLVIGLDATRNERYHQTDVWTGFGAAGELLSWRDAVYYARGSRAFATGGCMTRFSPLAAGGCEGVQISFELSRPSPHGFRPVQAVLDCSAPGASCLLTVLMAADIAGEAVLAHVVAWPGAAPRVHFVKPEQVVWQPLDSR